MLAWKFAVAPRPSRCYRTLESSLPRKKIWSTEYSDLIISVKIVSGLDAAIDHINDYGSRHTETIVTEGYSAAAARFMTEVDARAVSERLNALRRWLSLRFWRRAGHQQQQAACAWAHGPRRSHNV